MNTEDTKHVDHSGGDSVEELQAVKNRVHRELLTRINLEVIDQLDPAMVRHQVAEVVQAILAEQSVALNVEERQKLVGEVLDEVFGYGPLEPLLADDGLSDILVNGYREVYIERNGRLEKTPVVFRDNDHLMRIIDKIASQVGRRIDESSPMVDARLPDGSRVNAIIPPVSVDGPMLSIRKFSVDPYTVADLLRFKSAAPNMVDFLLAAVKARVNILITGGTGSGKTTLLNAMTAAIPHAERVVTIEDAAELQLQQPHVVRLETRPPNIEGKGQITQRDLVRNSLRMRPDRIIVGEVRGGEALDMLQAMNTGHDGSLTTLHANGPRDGLTRLEHMVGMAGVPIPALVVRQQIAAALDLVVDVERLIDGRRVVTSIQEVTGMEESVVNMQEIFQFKRHTVDEKGNVVGDFRATGIRPMMLRRFHERGVDLDEAIFNPQTRFE